jgi:hypothetical protein
MDSETLFADEMHACCGFGDSVHLAKRKLIEHQNTLNAFPPNTKKDFVYFVNFQT